MSKLLLFFMPFLLFGCTKPNSHWLVYTVNKPNYMFQITVDCQGDLTYQAGADFIAGRDTWKTKIDSEEIEEIELILYSIEDKGQESEFKAKVMVDGVQIVSEAKQKYVIDTLNRIVSNRYDFILDELPKPSADVLIERSVNTIGSD